MAITMPKILIEFKRLAETMSARSAQGTAILLMRDTTTSDTQPVVYASAASAQTSAGKYTTENAQYIQDTFAAGAATVAAVRIGEDITAALAAVTASTLTGWITICAGSADDFSALTTWIKGQETSGRCQYTGIVYNATNPNCQHVINFATTSVTFADARGSVPGSTFLPTLAGILAGCGVTRGCTYFACNTLTAASAVDDQDAALAAGKLFLFTDGADIRIARGINSLTDSDADDDLKFIDTVAVMDLIREDIISLWKSSYAGRYRNTLDNQMLFVSAVNSYFDGLAAESILDPDAENSAAIDVSAQRQAWVASGKSEASSWSDDIVKIKTFRRDVFLSGTIRVVGTMDNLTFPITLT